MSWEFITCGGYAFFFFVRDVEENWSFLGCIRRFGRKYLPMFRRRILPPSSGSVGPSLEASLTVYQSTCRRLCPGSITPHRMLPVVSPKRPGLDPRPVHDTDRFSFGTSILTCYILPFHQIRSCAIHSAFSLSVRRPDCCEHSSESLVSYSFAAHKK